MKTLSIILRGFGAIISIAVLAVIIFLNTGISDTAEADTSAGTAYGLEDDSDCVHEYTSESAGVCIRCGYVFVPEVTAISQTMYTTKDKCAVHSTCYGGNNVVGYLAKGTAVEVTASMYNAMGNLWYQTVDGTYIFGDYLKE